MSKSLACNYEPPFDSSHCPARPHPPPFAVILGLFTLSIKGEGAAAGAGGNRVTPMRVEGRAQEERKSRTTKRGGGTTSDGERGVRSLVRR